MPVCLIVYKVSARFTLAGLDPARVYSEVDTLSLLACSLVLRSLLYCPTQALRKRV